MAVLSAGTVSDYLAIASKNRFDWRNYNCGHFVLGWIKFAFGRDVTALLAEGNGNLKQFLSRLNRPLPEYVDEIAEQIGFERVDLIKPGDIVANQRVCLGLALPPYCVHVVSDGMLFLQAEPEAIWRNRLAF